MTFGFQNRRHAATDGCWICCNASPAPSGATSLMIYLAGEHGQVIGTGNVGMALVASKSVIFITASFTNVAYEGLPLDEDEALVSGGEVVVEMEPFGLQAL
ncbi:hypothetical protein L2E82_17483 [Cichorium intybus]|uniref:Uncharacterized protein n=1 Tax=Cichorium intybus TaxID=13427 RepID=A0ACB9F8E2_CICIN|nr:hypothetical protein L2E82_17483 [Cichorium intybus]